MESPIRSCNMVLGTASTYSNPDPFLSHRALRPHTSGCWKTVDHVTGERFGFCVSDPDGLVVHRKRDVPCGHGALRVGVDSVSDCRVHFVHTHEVTRYAKRVDRNHSEIRDGIKAAGYPVLDLSGVGGGVPDLCAQYGPGLSLFFEVKRPDIKKAAQAMTEAQEVWWRFNWQVTRIVQTLEEAIQELKHAKAQTRS
jgi:hypothetical protein